MMTFRRPHPLLTLIALVLTAATLKLSLWQFDRAEQKRAWEDAAAAATQADPVALSPQRPIQTFQRVTASGHYLADQQVLLENRVRQRQLGYYVLTPLTLADAGAVMVNRGWMAADGRRSLPAIPPPPPGLVTVQGVFYKDNADAFRLSEAPEQGTVRQNIDLAAYAEQSRLPLLSLVLIAEHPRAQPGLQAVSLRIDYKSAQSTIYAWQWLGFCALTIVFYGLLGFRKK